MVSSLYRCRRKRLSICWGSSPFIYSFVLFLLLDRRLWSPNDQNAPGLSYLIPSTRNEPESQRLTSQRTFIEKKQQSPGFTTFGLFGARAGTNRMLEGTTDELTWRFLTWENGGEEGAGRKACQRAAVWWEGQHGLTYDRASSFQVYLFIEIYTYALCHGG